MDFIQNVSGDILVLVALAVIYLLLEFGLDIIKELVVDRIKRDRLDHGENEWGGDEEDGN